jgi:RHS repeat-associated protein
MLTGRMDSDDELYQYFHDGLGSITMICDSTGKYQNLYVYDDFGNFRMMEEAGAVPNSYYYTGQERDKSPSGLYNLRARYYATGIGRYGNSRNWDFNLFE